MGGETPGDAQLLNHAWSVCAGSVVTVYSALADAADMQKSGPQVLQASASLACQARISISRQALFKPGSAARPFNGLSQLGVLISAEGDQAGDMGRPSSSSRKDLARGFDKTEIRCETYFTITEAGRFLCAARAQELRKRTARAAAHEGGSGEMNTAG